MARVTVEDCIDKVENRFDLVLLASHRARTISSGSQITVERDNDKNPVVALREIAETKLDQAVLKDSLISGMQKHADIDKPEEVNRGYGRSDDRGRASQGPGRAHSARGTARGRRVTASAA